MQYVRLLAFAGALVISVAANPINEFNARNEPSPPTITAAPTLVKKQESGDPADNNNNNNNNASDHPCSIICNEGPATTSPNVVIVGTPTASGQCGQVCAPAPTKRAVLVERQSGQKAVSSPAPGCTVECPIDGGPCQC